ncbi:cation diffusion facilitator family transporter [Melghirimyces algeriensis]|uniref:Cobalt-zinc-cadmium efflux system protein n=1 Tax=Melghirimyces algeriensis TaxID=910412 RepID=A0A521AUR3_9BACL|nr:cation diffusion facilitator family transporter [Melghirimyces algeriensis]SMO38330.1 cobalt-zinc-cadmium efflux system protein [Melghirimyces algeriensis]
MHHDQREQNKKGLTIALFITAGVMVLEFIGGLLTNSLALLSDSGHMLSDTASLALSMVAMRFATRPPSPTKSYGFFRLEILAALFNGVTLLLITGWIFWEAIQRFRSPPEVVGEPIIAIAVIGLVANLISAWFLMKKGDISQNVNLKSAYLHVLGDALGSLGAILAGGLMSLFAWYIADPVISVLVAVLILKGAWGVIRRSIHILMEGTPVAVDLNEVRRVLQAIRGVRNIHDLHIWTITSGLDALSCHLVIDDEQDEQTILQEAIQTVEERFHIRHTTIQVETSELKHPETEI